MDHKFCQANREAIFKNIIGREIVTNENILWMSDGKSFCKTEFKSSDSLQNIFFKSVATHPSWVAPDISSLFEMDDWKLEPGPYYTTIWPLSVSHFPSEYAVIHIFHNSKIHSTIMMSDQPTGQNAPFCNYDNKYNSIDAATRYCFKKKRLLNILLQYTDRQDKNSQK